MNQRNQDEHGRERRIIGPQPGIASPTNSGQRIAVEVAVVSRPERETEHIKKCLDAGYDRVFDIFADEGLMARTQQAMVGLFSDKEMARVRLLPLKKLEGFF